MSKKIDSALKVLVKALRDHADVVGGSHVSLKKSERASAKVQSAATAYAEAVYAKSGIETLFADVRRPGLDRLTLESLAAERDAISRNLTGSIPVQKKR